MTALAWLARTEEVAAALLLVLILGMVFTQVVARYVFSAPFFWADEFARYSYVWMAFVAACNVTARRTHVKIDVLDRVLPPRGVLMLEAFATLLVILTCLALVVGSWDWLMTTARPKSSALRMPMIYLYGVVWASFALMVLHSLVNVVLIARGRISVNEASLEDAYE